MPTLIIKALDCRRSLLPVDVVALAVAADDRRPRVFVHEPPLRSRERWLVDARVEFEDQVRVELSERATVRSIGDPLTVSRRQLPHGPKGGGLHRGRADFEVSGATYMLWYEVIPEGMDAADFHAGALAGISLRRALGRLGRGALTPEEFDATVESVLAYECRERISVAETLAFHERQDGGRGRTPSVSEWIRRHCNSWGEESVVSLAELPEGLPLADTPRVAAWQPVRDEGCAVLAGVVTASSPRKSSCSPQPTRGDLVFDLVPSPPFNTMVAYTAESRDIEARGRTRIRVPICRVEGKPGWMARRWRPEPGDYVTLWGHHVFDRGSMPMTTTLHPLHAMVREHTLNPPDRPDLDAFESVVGQLNRALVVTGSPSAALPHLVLETKLFPPGRRPTVDAVLWARIVAEELIEDSEESSDGSRDRVEHRLLAVRPRLHDRGDHFDLTIDLRRAREIAAGFIAEIYCGWARPP